MLILAQSDTTVGFLAKEPQVINKSKKRRLKTKVLMTVGSFKELNSYTRTPKHFRASLRRLKKTTFILDNQEAYRVIAPSSLHHRVIEKFGALYSSSANVTNKSYNENYAFEEADLIIKDSRGFYEGQSSTILKFGREKVRRVR